jgi:hypothetical protein
MKKDVFMLLISNTDWQAKSNLKIIYNFEEQLARVYADDLNPNMPEIIRGTYLPELFDICRVLDCNYTIQIDDWSGDEPMPFIQIDLS